MFYLIKDSEIIGTGPFQKSKGSVCVDYESANDEQKGIIDEYNKGNEKIIIKGKYKDIQKEISEKKGEIQEIEDTYETYTEDGKQIADIQKLKLEKDLEELRGKKDTLVLSAIEKYGIEVINELI